MAMAAGAETTAGEAEAWEAMENADGGEEGEGGGEEEDFMDVTVPPAPADRTLALLLGPRPWSRAATAKRAHAWP